MTCELPAASLQGKHGDSTYLIRTGQPTSEAGPETTMTWHTLHLSKTCHALLCLV